MAGIDSVNEDRNEEKQKVGSGRSVVDVGVQCNGSVKIPLPSTRRVYTVSSSSIPYLATTTISYQHNKS